SIRPAMFWATMSLPKAFAASSTVGTGFFSYDCNSSFIKRVLASSDGRNDFLAEKLDRAHDLVVGDAACLHEAHDLVHAGGLVFLDCANARFWIADAVGPVLEQPAQLHLGVLGRLLTHRRVVLVAGDALAAPFADDAAEHGGVPERGRSADRAGFRLVV